MIWGYIKDISLLVVSVLLDHQFYPWIYMITNIMVWEWKTRLLHIQSWYQWSCWLLVPPLPLWQIFHHHEYCQGSVKIFFSPFQMQQAVKAQKNLIAQNQLFHQGLLQKMNWMSQIVQHHTCQQEIIQRDINGGKVENVRFFINSINLRTY